MSSSSSSVHRLAHAQHYLDGDENKYEKHRLQQQSSSPHSYSLLSSSFSDDEKYEKHRLQQEFQQKCTLVAILGIVAMVILMMGLWWLWSSTGSGSGSPPNYYDYSSDASSSFHHHPPTAESWTGHRVLPNTGNEYMNDNMNNNNNNNNNSNQKNKKKSNLGRLYQLVKERMHSQPQSATQLRRNGNAWGVDDRALHQHEQIREDRERSLPDHMTPEEHQKQMLENIEKLKKYQQELKEQHLDYKEIMNEQIRYKQNEESEEPPIYDPDDAEEQKEEDHSTQSD